MTKTLVIIPAFNEQAAMPAALADLRDNFPQADVIVVDDGSRDDTCGVARRYGAVVAPLPFNMGIGAALRVGFRYADRHGYQRAVQFDADGQHDAREIRHLFRTLDAGADMAVGSRFAGIPATYQVSRVRRVAMEFLRRFTSFLAGRRFTDTSSGFRAFGPRAIKLFASAYPRDYMDSVEALVVASYAGLDVREVPVRMHERKGGVASNRRFRLVYHYLRLLLLLVLTASFSARRPKVERTAL